MKEGGNESGRNIQESVGKEVKVVRTCNETRRWICGQKWVYRNERELDQRGGGRAASSTA